MFVWICFLLIRIFILSWRGVNVVYNWVNIKFGKLNLLFGVCINSGWLVWILVIFLLDW